MDTLPNDLRVLINRHLDCYESGFLIGTEITKAKWAMYFYRDNHGEHFIGLFNDPDEELMRFFREAVLNGLKLKPSNVNMLGLMVGDIELIKSSGCDSSHAILSQQYHKFIIKAINKQQVDIVLHCDRPNNDKLIDNLNINDIEKLVTAYKTKNKTIIDHVVIANKYNILHIENILYALVGYNGDAEEFKTLFNKQFENRRCHIPHSLLYAAIVAKNKEVYNFLMGFEEINRPSILELYLVSAIELKSNDMAELIFLDLKQPPTLNRIIHYSYSYGCKKIFYKVIELNPHLINTLNIFDISMCDVDVEFLKFILVRKPPSQEDISKLMSNAVAAHRYDLYCYLCTVKMVIDDNAKFLGSLIEHL